MNVSIIIATYGDDYWTEMARKRAIPSANRQGTIPIYWHDPEGTIASVRNSCGESARDDWLCFLDADDELAPGYLEAMRQAYERESRDDGTPLLLTPAIQAVRKGRDHGRPSFWDRGIPLTKDNWLPVGTLVQRDLFIKVGGFGDYPHGFEDWSLWYKCWKAGARIVKVPNAIYRYHLNPRSKHKLGWRDRRWQVETHQKVEAELAAWTP